MKKNAVIILMGVVLIGLSSCCPSFLCTGKYEEYKNLAPAVTQASSLLIILEPEELPNKLDGEFYKSLLLDGYKPLYTLLYPYKVELESLDADYLVKVFDGDEHIITDSTSTEGRLDIYVFEK